MVLVLLYNFMEKLDSVLCQWTLLYTNYFNFQFSYCNTFYKPNNIKTKPSKKVKTLFEFTTIKGQINVPLWTHMEHGGWKDAKTLLYHWFKILRWI